MKTRRDNATPARNGRVGRWFLLGTAVLQAAAPTLVGFDSSTADPPIVPPGPFFAVWGVVIIGCLLAAAWGVPARRAGASPYRDIQVPLSLVQVGFTVWLIAAGSSVAWLTAPVFAAMLVGLAICLRRVLSTPVDTRPERLGRAGLSGVLGVYAGWTTAAVWINVATLLPAGALAGTGGIALQCAFVGAAAGAAAVGAYALRGQASYTLTAGWALIGVTVSAVMASLPALAATAVAGLLLVGTVALLRRGAVTARRPA